MAASGALPANPRLDGGPAMAPRERLALRLEGLVPPAVQALEDPDGQGYAQFVRRLADLLLDLVHESVDAHVGDVWPVDEERPARVGGRGFAGDLRLVSKPAARPLSDRWGDASDASHSNLRKQQGRSRSAHGHSRTRRQRGP